MRQLPRPVPGVIAACLLLSGAIASAQSPLDDYTPVTGQMLVDPPADDWPMWRRTYNHWGHSPLDQIDTANVGGLRLAWAWTMAEGLQETTPLVHDGVMFLVQACDYVEALDVRDGTRLWEYRRPRVEHGATLACASRNGTLYEDKLFIGTHDAHLVALDARTGEVVWDVTVGDWEVGQHYSGGPQVIKGRVVAGMSGCYYLNTRCWISAHDAETGEEVWRTYTIPREGEFGYDSWGDIPDELRRGGSSWNAPSYDPELNLIYAGVGVPIPWGSVQRGTGDGDVLYTNSTLALDADTGAIVWYFQHTPNDEWDLDHPYARLVVETEVSPDPDAVEWLNGGIIPGSRRKIVTGIPGKTGIVWALDAATGAFLWAEPTNRQNVVADVDAESRRVLLNEELKFPQVGEPMFVCPSLTGGINWNATAYHPGTNALYAPTNNVCMTLTLNEFRDRPGFHHGSARATREVAPDVDGQVGMLTAMDMATGATRWVHRQRAGIGGSVLTTGGGLVFVTDDARRFRAFDAATGDILWERILNSSAGGFPVSYMHDGVQYVAIAAGGGVNYRMVTPEIRQPPRGNILWVFRLP
ncbi:MAG: PQQ-binding-like beta-propeller repeat protein [Acidobacteria bacterium]|nr:PQQ-binding-like beta-propeller repeat protein [Acidobacteriota bacterium]